MVSVVCAIEVFAIPARGEVNLRAKTIRTVVAWEIVGLWFPSTKTSKGDGFAGEIAAEAAFVAITSQHSEAGWVGFESLGCSSGTTLLVVDCHAAIEILGVVSNGGNRSERPIGILEVEFWCPVVGKILLDRARTTLGSSGLFVGHIEAESVPTSDLVGVAGHSTWKDDGIRSFLDDVIGAAEADIG